MEARERDPTDTSNRRTADIKGEEKEAPGLPKKPA